MVSHATAFSGTHKIMGHVDYQKLNPIYGMANSISKTLSLPFCFEVDSDTIHSRTTIIFNIENGSYRKPNPTKESISDIRYPEISIVPDICDYEHKIIIEYEEETGSRKSGAHYAKKGHGHEGDLDKKRDGRRNECYEKAGFKLLRLWESTFKKSEIWKIVVAEFLIDCWRKNLNDSMTPYVGDSE